MNKTSTIDKIWDKVGICASGLCLIHCLATPFLLLLFPASKMALIDSHTFHEFFAVLVVSSILIAVYPTCRRHGHKDIIITALIGVGFIFSAIFLPIVPVTLSHILTIIGSVFLIIAHIKNMKVRHGRCETKTACSGH